MKDIFYLPLTEIQASELTPREWLTFCWLRMGKPKNLKKFMTKSYQILARSKNSLWDKGYLTKDDFMPHNKHIRK